MKDVDHLVNQETQESTLKVELRQANAKIQELGNEIEEMKLMDDFTA